VFLAAESRERAGGSRNPSPRLAPLAGDGGGKRWSSTEIMQIYECKRLWGVNKSSRIKNGAPILGAPFCDSTRKEPTMSQNIVEALLYAALAIVHFWRS
jgi:hypothetical protein